MQTNSPDPVPCCSQPNSSPVPEQPHHSSPSLTRQYLLLLLSPMRREGILPLLWVHHETRAAPIPGNLRGKGTGAQAEGTVLPGTAGEEALLPRVTAPHRYGCESELSPQVLLWKGSSQPTLCPTAGCPRTAPRAPAHTGLGVLSTARSASEAPHPAAL